ncbi:VQ motif-containing protein 4-like [Gastrolobium bilobum]|uniref:VQ motif-containing protein 4-like n=1 Tax=Gastrolobium bilobum TaxID=150636 RepID=UPI002AB10441|nr:VQ motif-containing protein 4-like [Gastrolobium bilobum]
MDISLRLQDRENQSLNSPRTNLSNSMSSSNSIGIKIPTPPLTPNTIPRSDSNPYPTTFVQADTSTFKQVVQMLTGPSETTKPASSKAHPQDPIPPTPSSSSSSRNFNIPPMKIPPKKQQGFKLYERRNNNLKNTLMINTLMPNFAQNSGFSPRKPEILSPSLLDFPSLALSPVTPLNDDPFDKSSPSLGSSSEEDKAIAEKGFYLHPSPMSTPRDFEPQLLPLFPVTSPRISESPS